MTRPQPVARMDYREYVAAEVKSDRRQEFLNGEVFAMAGGMPEHGALAAAMKFRSVSVGTRHPATMLVPDSWTYSIPVSTLFLCGLWLLAACAGSDDDAGSDSCHTMKAGCPSDAPASVWEDLARASGFPTDPGSDFFAFARYGCIVDVFAYPLELRELVEASPLIVLGRIDDVVAQVKPYFTTDEADYMVRYSVAVERVIKGDMVEPVLINEICATGGKVAGLRNTIPDARFLFFLDGPWPIDPDFGPAPGEQLAYGLGWYYLGVVRETAAGNVEFAHDPGASAALLGGLHSLDEVAQAVSSASE